MEQRHFREAIVEYIQREAIPPDKFEHQLRLYALAKLLAQDYAHDDDVIHAAAWLHDLGVFAGHRPEDLAQLEAWDNVAYAMHRSPDLLEGWGFPKTKIPAVIEAIRTHQPFAQPATREARILHDADILEQLGAVGILRVVSKVGRDTRFAKHTDALRVLRKCAAELPAHLEIPLARKLAQERVAVLQAFFDAADREGVN